MKKNRKRQKEFRIEKVIRKKGNELYVKLKGCDNSFNSYIGKRDTIIYRMSSYSKPNQSDVKNVTGIDISDFAERVDLASFRSDADELDID